MKTHGLSRARLYYVWKNIKNRCCRTCHATYKWYGGRGITICDEWKNDPVAFIAWCKSHGYKDGLQIDRIDNDKGYSPDNCRFVTPKENLQNTSTNVRLTYRGETRTIAEWSEQLGLPYAVIRERYCHGWDIEDIFTMPVNKNLRRDKSKVQMLTYKGETHTLSEWAKITNLKWWTVQNRVRLGWSPEKILETPEKRRRIA